MDGNLSKGFYAGLDAAILVRHVYEQQIAGMAEVREQLLPKESSDPKL
jgi:hypothetical protein